MNEPHYLTREGFDKLKNELEHLKTTGRVELSARLRAAIQLGDLSENADYIKAKEDQGFLEGRILELDEILTNAAIIDEMEKGSDMVRIGNTVTVKEGNYPEETYFLVGPKEADPMQGRISHESPIGKALLDHKVGDVVSVNSPGGELKLKITKIE